MSIEQMCRDLLEVAIREGLTPILKTPASRFWFNALFVVFLEYIVWQ